MDAADRAQATTEHLNTLRTQSRHVMRASNFCVSCGELIETQRLKAVPTAERCVFCQQDHERLNKLYGNG